MTNQFLGHALASSFWPKKSAICGALLALGVCAPRPAGAALQWAGRSWNVTSGGMAGVCQGNPANVSVDSNGYLHLKISKNGATWSAAEIFSTEKLGFGTYQWQVDGPIDHFDPNVVLGLYPYGPDAGIGQDGTNEIDIEYSRWGHADGPNGDWTDYPASGTTIGEKTYTFSLNGGTLSTSRFIWSTSSIQSFLIKGLQAVGSNTDLINSWTYAPNNSQTNIPQQALPLGMNLWCFDKTPTDGMPVEVVIRDFKFVALGSDPGGTGGAGGTGAGGASSGGSSGSTGTAGHGGSNASAGAGGNAAGMAGASSAAGGAGAGTGGANAGTAGAATTGNAGSSGALSAGTAGDGAGANSAGGGNASGSAGTASGSAGAGDATDNVDQGSNCSVSAVGSQRGAALLGLLPLFVLGVLGRRARRRTRR